MSEGGGPMSHHLMLINNLKSLTTVFGLTMITILFMHRPGIAQTKIKQDQEGGSERIRILNANTLKYTELKGKKVRKLIGDVKFKQKGVTMDCDSAYQFEQQNLIKAFHNIHINQGDTMHLTGKFLRYSGNTRKAIIKENVKLEEKTEDIILTTDTLHYEMENSRAYYNTGGEIKDSVNRLTSIRGIYLSNAKKFTFKDSVRLFNPDYTIYCDTLQYHTPTEKAFFFGPTEIISDSNYLYCENGWYDTKKNKARFGKNAFLRSGEKRLFADSLFYDREKKYGKARFNIRLIDTAEKLTLTGENGEYYEKQKPSYITDSALGRKIHTKDTFYLHADTLKSTYDSQGRRLMQGYYGAKSFHRDFQSQADSIIYAFSDSTIYLYHGPVMWYNNYQLTADKMRIITDGNGKAEKMYLTDNALIISKLGGERYNQIKGRKMTGYFKDNELKRVFVEGNSEAIYYLLDDNDKYIGINKIQSSNIRIKLKEREINKITFLQKPQATVHPIKGSNPENFRFPGFNWLSEDRPGSVADLFKPFTVRRLKPSKAKK